MEKDLYEFVLQKVKKNLMSQESEEMDVKVGIQLQNKN
jgi:hypothetical protein